MAELKTYRVNRRLDGDRLYEDGDTRVLTEVDARALVDSGALTLIGDGPDVETPPPAPVEVDRPAVITSALVQTERTAPAVATKQGAKRA